MPWQRRQVGRPRAAGRASATSPPAKSFRCTGRGDGQRPSPPRRERRPGKRQRRQPPSRANSSARCFKKPALPSWARQSTAGQRWWPPAWERAATWARRYRRGTGAPLALRLRRPLPAARRSRWPIFGCGEASKPPRQRASSSRSDDAASSACSLRLAPAPARRLASRGRRAAHCRLGMMPLGGLGREGLPIRPPKTDDCTRRPRCRTSFSNSGMDHAGDGTGRCCCSATLRRRALEQALAVRNAEVVGGVVESPQIF